MDTSKEIKFIGYFLPILLIVVVLVFIILNIIFKYPNQLVSGISMEPTIHDPETVRYDPEKNPQENDIIIFNCLVEKCNGKYLIKRVINIDTAGNYWVEGDNKAHSTDSRKYGWLSPSDISISGVVIQ